jgi:hypothetical protein
MTAPKALNAQLASRLLPGLLVMPHTLLLLLLLLLLTSGSSVLWGLCSSSSCR